MTHFTRRQAIQTSLASTLGLSLIGGLPSLSAANDLNPLANKPAPVVPKAKRAIMFFLTGGVSACDTFDPKPALRRDHGKEVRKERVLAASRWDSHRYGDSGLELTDLFPHLGRCADDLCLIRSMHGDKGDHFEATLSMHSGAKAGVLPGIGAWISYGLGTLNASLPSHVVFCEKLPYAGSQPWDSNFLPAYHQGTRIVPASEPIPNLTPDAVLSRHQDNELALLQRMNARHRDARPGDQTLDARMYSFQSASDLQRTAPQVFDLAGESEETLDMYGITRDGPRNFGWQCLMARRMSERGVRFIELVDTGASGNWDAHSNMKSYEKLSRNVDRPMAALIADLKQRGLLDETLVICCTEFGRTPSAPKSQMDGRDHFKDAFTCWLAGGGTKGGFAYGATDEHGQKIVENPVHIHDFHATILHLMGIDHTKLTYSFTGRDFRLTGLAGNVVHGVIA